VYLTLDPLVTETSVELDERLERDEFELDGAPAREPERLRVSALLDEVRALAGVQSSARVVSRNHFPTAAGLASSASGFAALAAAASRAVGLDEPLDVLSARARRASASAARSIFGGVVALPAGEPGDDALCAHPIAPADHWDLRVVVAVTASGRKPIGSRAAMGESRRGSPYYDAWVEHARRSAVDIEAALLARDFDALAPLVEQSFFAMHAVGMAGIPSILYWRPGSVAAISAVRALRAEGVEVCATMDAGPHVKAICTASSAPRVAEALAALPEVLDTIEARIGPGVEIDGEPAAGS